MRKGKNMKNKEIELKFVISSDQKDMILKELENIAKFESEKRQIDTYYIPKFKSFEENGETKECLRIRESDGKNVLCYKNIHREVIPVYCDEYELEIASSEEMEKVLFAIGFEIQMKIDKIRKTFLLDAFEIALDQVNGSLELLEVELKDENASTDDILDFVKKFGLTKEDVTYRGIQLLVKDLGI